MRKKITRRSKIQLVCRQAKPGAALSFLKNMVLFCKSFNEKTKDMEGLINVEIIVYSDNSYDYVLGNPPITSLIKEIIERKNKDGRNIKEIDDNDFDWIISKAKSSFNVEEKENIRKTIEGTLKSFNKKV